MRGDTRLSLHGPHSLPAWLVPYSGPWVMPPFGTHAGWQEVSVKGINDLFLESRAYLMLSVPCLTGTPRAA